MHYVMYSRHAEKYVRRGRLDWPEGATSRDSIRAVTKLPRLPVITSVNRPSDCFLSPDACFEYVLSVWFSVPESGNAACGSFRRCSYTSSARSS